MKAAFLGVENEGPLRAEICLIYSGCSGSKQAEVAEAFL